MEGPESSLMALEALRHWRSEAVLLPLGVNAGAPPPSIGEPLTAHVRVVAEGAEKLPETLLLGVLVVDDHKDALAGLKVFPQGVFVTLRGDCFTVRGWKPRRESCRCPQLCGDGGKSPLCSGLNAPPRSWSR